MRRRSIEGKTPQRTVFGKRQQRQRQREEEANGKARATAPIQS